MEQRKYKIKLTEPLLGTIPKDQQIFSRYVQSKYYGDDMDDPDITDEKDMQRQQEISAVPSGEGETGFFTDADGIYIMGHHVKGFLKEAGNVLKDVVKVKALRSKIDNFLFVEPRYIYLKEKPDGRLERPLRANTPQGPRVSLVSSDYVDAGVEFEITITLLPHKELKWKIVEQLLDYGKLKGLGQWRNGGRKALSTERVKS